LTNEKLFKSTVENSFVSDYAHLHRKLLRSGSLHVNTSVKVLKNYLRQYHSYPNYFRDVLPFAKSDHVFKELLHTIMPYR
jgi:hypothetical protein